VAVRYYSLQCSGSPLPVQVEIVFRLLVRLLVLLRLLVLRDP
jgi:hypothetical protein